MRYTRPQLEDDTEEDQSQDLQTYLTHHNTYEESKCIHRDYRASLLELDDDRYYQEIDRVYQTYGPLPAQDHILANQAPGPCRMMVRGEVRRVEKNSTDINLSEQEQDHCRVTYNGRLRKHSV